ncbi:hypothetical protein HMPREF9005_0971 [Actinomyces sp. oral taxon 178 str. F0338]|nr:hypothetical protein HMPREF9005_0971 [Actinomyces sp. oral taxon 178 str. F0338]
MAAQPLFDGRDPAPRGRAAGRRADRGPRRRPARDCASRPGQRPALFTRRGPG